MLDKHLEFDGLTGVGKVQLDFVPDQRVYTLIGVNGVGKTKTLEALFQLYFFSNHMVNKPLTGISKIYLKFRSALIHSSILGNHTIDFPESNTSEYFWDLGSNSVKEVFNKLSHTYPVVYLGAQARGAIKEQKNISTISLGNIEGRRLNYFHSITKQMESEFGSMNMATNIQEWFIQIARSSNSYQSAEDNREIELKTVLRLLHEIDNRIDEQYLVIGGDDRVSLKIDGQKIQLSQLSSGFSSILKLIQSIVSGYGHFTNETNLQNVKGIVFIDEIESHLHLSWQANIIPLLKRLFPNTTFYVTTHSSVVLLQLQEGEAYELQRDKQDGIVKSRLIPSPNKAAFADILRDVFHVDVNKIKLENSTVGEQQEAKNNLLNLLRNQEGQ
ncbi:AAA family ATPase [Providencia rettgeri]|uniref:AAA family ATPase n=1 Tax=Providencia rettgeri TaxID=587 RepID=UPI000F791102|nr:AAA family ATPase [Providencia rettgeri]MBV2191256.1 ATP-binding protein [Providencia rettgeri]